MVLVAVGALLAIGAIPLAIREVGAYRRRDDTDDLFRYTRRRLIRRVTGLVILAGVGATLAIWELAPPADPGSASMLLGLLLVEVVALVVIAVLDMRETSTTARFHRGNWS